MTGPLGNELARDFIVNGREEDQPLHALDVGTQWHHSTVIQLQLLLPRHTYAAADREPPHVPIQRKHPVNGGHGPGSWWIGGAVPLSSHVEGMKRFILLMSIYNAIPS